MSEPIRPLIVALDFDDLDSAVDLVDKLDPATCRVKVGKQLFTRVGPAAVEQLVARKFDVFLDLKFHDIPNTVAKAAAAAARARLRIHLVFPTCTARTPACWLARASASAARAAAARFRRPDLLVMFFEVALGYAVYSYTAKPKAKRKLDLGSVYASKMV